MRIISIFMSLQTFVPMHFDDRFVSLQTHAKKSSNGFFASFGTTAGKRRESSITGFWTYEPLRGTPSRTTAQGHMSRGVLLSVRT